MLVFLDTHGQCVLSRNTPSVSCQLQNTSTTTIVTVHPSVIQLVSLLSRIKRFQTWSNQFHTCVCLTSVSRFDSVQYGQYHDTSMLKNEVMMTSLMINLDSHADFFNEIPEYSEYMVRAEICSLLPKTCVQLFSDIGGAAGLILGMSFSTIVSILDWFISMLATFAQKQLVKCCTKV